MLLQHRYGLSDPQLGNRLSFQKFVGIRSGEPVPDETAICRFRQRMITAGLHERLLELFNEQLAAAGYMVKRTMLVDATQVESSRCRPARQEAREGRYAKKHGKSYYGYKAHISADGDNQLVCRALLTRFTVDDSKVFGELIDARPRARLRRPNLRQLAQQGLSSRTWQCQRHYEKGGNHIVSPRKTGLATGVRTGGGDWSNGSSPTGKDSKIIAWFATSAWLKPTRTYLESRHLTTCGAWSVWPPPKARSGVGTMPR